MDRKSRRWLMQSRVDLSLSQEEEADVSMINVMVAGESWLKVQVRGSKVHKFSLICSCCYWCCCCFWCCCLCCCIFCCCCSYSRRRTDVRGPAPNWDALSGRTPSSSGSGQTAADDLHVLKTYNAVEKKKKKGVSHKEQCFLLFVLTLQQKHETGINYSKVR